MEADFLNTRPVLCGEAIKHKINVCPMELQSLKTWSFSWATFYSLVSDEVALFFFFFFLEVYFQYIH